MSVPATTGDLRPPLLFARKRVCAAQKSLFRRRANAIHKSGGREPAVAWGIAWPARLRTYPHTVVGRVTRSGGREPAVAFGNRACEDNSHTFADDCRTRNQERRVSARRGAIDLLSVKSCSKFAQPAVALTSAIIRSRPAVVEVLQSVHSLLTVKCQAADCLGKRTNFRLAASGRSTIRLTAGNTPATRSSGRVALG